MSKSSDVRFGRRGGREIPAGVEPGNGVDDIEAIRAQAIADGTWPADSDDQADEQLGLFG